MKYWRKRRNSNGYGENCLLLIGGDKRILSVTSNIEEGTVTFGEECDGCFFEDYTKKQSIELLEELLNYIKNEN